MEERRNEILRELDRKGRVKVTEIRPCDCKAEKGLQDEFKRKKFFETGRLYTGRD
mgnify:CR=1 FL=1